MDIIAKLEKLAAHMRGVGMAAQQSDALRGFDFQKGCNTCADLVTSLAQALIDDDETALADMENQMNKKDSF